MQRSDFAARVESLVSSIPHGRVMTYGQLAALCGNPQAARVVGGIAHFGDSNLPWHRVVNKRGGMASGYPGGKSAHAKHLQSEGVSISSDYEIKEMETALWQPKNNL